MDTGASYLLIIKMIKKKEMGCFTALITLILSLVRMAVGIYIIYQAYLQFQVGDVDRVIAYIVGYAIWSLSEDYTVKLIWERYNI